MTPEFEGHLKKPIIIRHFKGNHYLLLSVGFAEKTGEKMAVYMSFKDSKVYVRPYKEFLMM